jgi:hypothetical protein
LILNPVGGNMGYKLKRRNEMAVDKSYTKIPLDQLDYIRLELRAKLKKLEVETGERYFIRTFFCGPREKALHYRPSTTLKTVATAAKIAIYKEKQSAYGYKFRDLDRYI